MPIESLRNIGHITIETVESLGNFGMLAARAVGYVFVPPFRVGLILAQMEFVGVHSLFIVCLTGTFTGMVFALQTHYAFSLFGSEALVGSTLAVAIVRELAPVFCALLITGRAGSAMAAEIGTMRVTEQVDALAVMAVDPVHYLVVPRVIASLLMLPVMTMIFNGVGMAGGYLVGVHMLGINEGAFINNIRLYLEVPDITSGLIKAAVFGVALSLCGCYKGYFTSGGARGVGQATTAAVVLGSVSIFVLDYFVTALLIRVGFITG